MMPGKGRTLRDVPSTFIRLGFQEVLFSVVLMNTIFLPSAESSGRSSNASGVAPLPDRIVFRADVDGSSEIFVMDLNGSNRTQLTATPDAFDLLPELSADGRKIVFISTNENNTSWNPSLMNVDGTSRSVLPLPGIIGRATLSPDRKRVAFTAHVDSRSRIFTSKLDGTDLTQITSGATGPTENDPKWVGLIAGADRLLAGSAAQRLDHERRRHRPASTDPRQRSLA